MVKRNIPEVRFKDFADNWEERKLMDIAKKVSTKNIDLAVSETFTNSAEYGVISQRDYFDHDVTNAENIGGYYVIGENDFVYNPRISAAAPVGPVNRNKLNRKGVMSPLYTIFKTHDIDLSFLEFYFKGNKWHNYMYFNGDTGARFDRFSIRNEVFFDMPVPYPKEEEQIKIGEYLKNLDGMMILHKIKYEKLKLFKEAMLDKMFPKNGEKVPEIRFKGFDGEWERRELKTLCDNFIDGDWIETKDQSESGIRLIQTGNIGIGKFIDKACNKKWISQDTFKRLHCTEVYPGDILISRLPEPAGRACIIPELYTKAITAVDCTIVRMSDKYNSKFLIQYLSTKSYFDEVNTCLAGGTRQRISRSSLEKFDVVIPKDMDEQEVIGEFFSNLDNLITIQRLKYEKLNQLKEAMLDKMF